MQMMIDVVLVALAVAVLGYVISVLRERQDLLSHKVVIKSEKVTQRLLDDIDLKMFKLGKFKLFIGDEVRVRLKDNQRIRGVLLGAKKGQNALCLVTNDDEIVELNVKSIVKLKVLSKYGRLF